MAVVRKILIGLVGVFIVLQFIPVDRENPAVQSDIETPADIKTILRAACYDCHSNETKWPFYSYIAPMSWQVADHVKEGRKELNFSEWNKYTIDQKMHKLEEVVEEVEEKHMPLPDYLLLHPEAKMDEARIEALAEWAESAIETLEEAADAESDSSGQ